MMFISLYSLLGKPQHDHTEGKTHSLDSRVSEVLPDFWCFWHPIPQLPDLFSRPELIPSASFCSLIGNYSFSWLFSIFSVSSTKHPYDPKCNCAVTI